jgi:hypothetical protein
MNIFLRKSILIALLFVACQPPYSNQVLPTYTTPTSSMPIITSIATQTFVASPSITLTLFDQNTRVLELPRWVRYSFPGGILALPYGDAVTDRPSKFVLVNPDTGETFVVDLQREFYHYLWSDSENIAFFHEGDCDRSPKYISELDTFSGTLSVYESNNYPKYILDCYPNSDDEMVRLNHEFNELAVELVNPSSGEISLLTNPNDGVSDISIQISPYDDFVAVVQFDGEFEMAETRKPVYGNQISIFDLKTQELILQYSEEQGILSEVSFIDYANLAYMRGNTPCLIMILSQFKKCVHNIPNRFPDSTIILSKNSYHDTPWFRFLYFSQQQGGYCAYDIISGGLGCVTDRFPIFNNQFVINYSLSSFGHYVLLEYSSDGCPVLWCAYPENTYLALIDFQEGELFELGSSDSYYLSGLFRPLHPDPWQPWR